MLHRGTIALVSGTEQTRKTLVEQLESYLGDVVQIQSYALDEGLDETIKADLVILSTHLITEEARPLIDESCQVVVARRAINYSKIEPVFFIPAGTDVLLVNDVRETTLEALESLKMLGIDHVNYILFYPGIQPARKAKIAVTLGEVGRVPDFVEEIIDIGPRLIDIATLIEILKCLNILDEQGGAVNMRYLQKIIELGQKLARSTNEIGELNIYLNQVLDSLNDGILAFTPSGELNVCNENVKEMLKVGHCKVQGRNIRSLIRHDKLLAFLLGDGEGRQFFTINGQDLLVQRMVHRKDGSIIATFKNASETIEIEKKMRTELIKKGYVGKYTFADIVGESPNMLQTKTIAEKLARADAAVLIEGESGTGKELYASAIHNASPRRKGPFLAVNFSALPDDLVESELFGYEEGAFTGAKKGGKAGLFEQASGGTIFLDEIGDISIKVQARLLRVLQEKEIMRVGGTRIIPIDVRVIAATNKNLVELIRRGEFREDLYHRLKVLYLKLPPLRERKEDLRPLIQHFLNARGGNGLSIDEEVYARLSKFEWYGNVRELENTIDYMLAVADEERIGVKDLPALGFFQYEPVIEETASLSEVADRGEAGGRREIFSKGEAVDRSEVARRSEAVGRSEILSRSEASGRSEVVRRDEVVGRNEVASGNEIVCRNETVGWSEAAISSEEVHTSYIPQAVRQEGKNAKIMLTPEQLFLLESIGFILTKREIPGRQRLMELGKERGFALTENQIRYRLNELEKLGLVVKHKGRTGTRLTDLGRQMMEQHSPKG